MNVLYKLKIELEGSDPKIRRRIIVPGDTPFLHLHDIIQICMGWQGLYSFEFLVDKTTVFDFGGDIHTGDNPYEKDAADCELSELVTMVNFRFDYIYDLDDRWMHKITLEDIVTQEEEPAHPVCVDGEGACPPDDCGGITRYQEMLSILGNRKHPKHNNIKLKFERNEQSVRFDIDEVNDRLRRYAKEWDEIYDETGDIIYSLENGNESYTDEDEDSDYESVKHLRSPQDLFNDEYHKREMESTLDEGLAYKKSKEYKTSDRLIKQGHFEEDIRAMLLGALSIEWFYDLKYESESFGDRYERNLDRLPEKPDEIYSIGSAVLVLNTCRKGIPFTAIEYLHNEDSREATTVIVDALKNFSDHQYCWEDCTATPIWYALAAEGHLCEELIDPVITIYRKDNINASDWIHEQGQYLIGKLAQKIPDATTDKVLTAMEKDAKEQTDDYLYFLFDVFCFCDLDKYKDRLIALLKRDDVYWHDALASTLAHLQVKEALPVLREQLVQLKTSNSEEQSARHWNITEIGEAIDQLEKGVNLYPEVDTPLCLKRPPWREEYADKEHFFYDEEYFDDDFAPGDYSDSDLPSWEESHQEPITKTNKTNRNDPCPCGSGKKYKKCCLDKELQRS